jgi:hypothetical protein
VSAQDRAAAVVVQAAWHDRPVGDVGGVTLWRALELARRNQVEARLARCAGEELPSELARTREAADAWRRNLGEASALLAEAGVTSVLIKSPPPEDCVYSNFDLVVGRERWVEAQRALAGWAVRTSGHPLEPDKLLVHPPAGPAAHLHRDVSWFGVVVVEAARLRSLPAPDGAWRVPVPADELRIVLGHALFQNLAVDLSELRGLRGLLDDATVAEAAALAGEEGWGAGFVEAVALVRQAVAELDRSRPPTLPLPLPLRLCAAVGLEHARAGLRSGARAAALRELGLRPPLIAAKRLRALRAAA